MASGLEVSRRNDSLRIGNDLSIRSDSEMANNCRMVNYFRNGSDWKMGSSSAS